MLQKSICLCVLAAITASQPKTHALTPVGWELSATFDDPSITRMDRFGFSVDIEGDLVVAGAIWDDNGGSNSGQAYLFDVGSPAAPQILNNPLPLSIDQFGRSTSISGSRVLVGSVIPRASSDPLVNLFDANGSLLRSFSDPTPTHVDQFGISVALEDNLVLVGDPGDNTDGRNVGRAHLFDANTGTLLHSFQDPTVTTEDWFGISVAMDGQDVLIGSFWDDTGGLDVGQVHLFDALSGNLMQTFNDPTSSFRDSFGASVAIDGDYVLIGAPGDMQFGFNIGEAHLFDKNTGALIHTFNDPTITNRDEFGLSVAISGNNVLIGAPTDDSQGENVGQAYLFDAESGLLLEIFDSPNPTGLDLFGSSVSISGNNLVIGAPGNSANGDQVGQAYLFTFVPEPNTVVTSTLGLAVLGFLWRLRK